MESEWLTEATLVELSDSWDLTIFWMLVQLIWDLPSVSRFEWQNTPSVDGTECLNVVPSMGRTETETETELDNWFIIRISWSKNIHWSGWFICLWIRNGFLACFFEVSNGTTCITPCFLGLAHSHVFLGVGFLASVTWLGRPCRILFLCTRRRSWITGQKRLIQSHSLAKFCFELSRNSN